MKWMMTEIVCNRQVGIWLGELMGKAQVFLSPRRQNKTKLIMYMASTAPRHSPLMHNVISEFSRAGSGSQGDDVFLQKDNRSLNVLLFSQRRHKISSWH